MRTQTRVFIGKSNPSLYSYSSLQRKLKIRRAECTAIQYSRFVIKGHPEGIPFLGPLRCYIFRVNWDSTYGTLEIQN